MGKFNVVFCGTPDFSIPSLELLYHHPQVDLKYVITMPDRPSGRGQKLTPPPVALYAKEHQITLIQTENINKESTLIEKMKSEKIDFIIVLAFAQFLSNKLLTLPIIGCFNIHTSLLPKYRGAAPIQYALLNGDKTTGVSIQKMVKKMDAGDLVCQSEIPLAHEETGGQLYVRLKFLAALTLNDLITKIFHKDLQYLKQDENLVSFAPTLSKEDGFLDFTNCDVARIHNQVRALSPWPGTYCYLGKKRLKVLEIGLESTFVAPGKLNIDYGFLAVGLRDGTIRLKKVQLEGKRVCSDLELLNGLSNNIGLDLTLNP